MLEAKHLGNLKERHRNKQINFSAYPKIQNSNAKQPNLHPTLRNRREGNHNSKASLFPSRTLNNPSTLHTTVLSFGVGVYPGV